jgi:hypothetical protein
MNIVFKTTQKGFRRAEYHYKNSPTYADFSVSCPYNCSDISTCTLYFIWSGKSMNGELAVTELSPIDLKPIGATKFTKQKINRYQECFIAKNVNY